MSDDSTMKEEHQQRQEEQNTNVAPTSPFSAPPKRPSTSEGTAPKEEVEEHVEKQRNNSHRRRSVVQSSVVVSLPERTSSSSSILAGAKKDDHHHHHHHHHHHEEENKMSETKMPTVRTRRLSERHHRPKAAGANAMEVPDDVVEGVPRHMQGTVVRHPTTLTSQTSSLLSSSSSPPSADQQDITNQNKKVEDEQEHLVTKQQQEVEDGEKTDVKKDDDKENQNKSCDEKPPTPPASSSPSAAAAAAAVGVADRDDRSGSKRNSPSDSKRGGGSPPPPSPPQQRTYMMTQELLPTGATYWSSSDCNPWQRKQQAAAAGARCGSGDGGGEDEDALVIIDRRKRNKKKTATNTSSRVDGQQQHQQQQQDNIQEQQQQDHTSDNQRELALRVPGAVGVTSCHRGLRGARGLPPGYNLRHRVPAPSSYIQSPAASRVEEKKREESPLGHFVRLPAVTRPAAITKKMRNSDARRKAPEVVHVDEDAAPPSLLMSANNEQQQHQQQQGGGPVHAPDQLERQAVALLVPHDPTGSPIHGAKNENGARLCIISPTENKNKKSSFSSPSSPLSSSSSSSHSHQLLPEGMRRTASIPSRVAPVAEEASASHVVVYEAYDRVYAERKLKALSEKGKTTLSARRPVRDSRLYQSKARRQPEGFSSTEEAIVQLAREHDARGRGSDMKSMESLLGVAVSHKDLAVLSSRNVARSTKPVIPRGRPADHAPYTTRSVYASPNDKNNSGGGDGAAHAITNAWVRDRGVDGILRRAKDDLALQQATEAKNQRQLVLLEQQSDFAPSDLAPSPLQQQGQLVEVRIPSLIPGGASRVVGYQQQNQQQNQNQQQVFSLTPRLNQQSRATDSNYAMPPLPSAPSDAPQRFAELMRARMEQAAKEAVPMMVRHS